jgi:hypothetical protein
MIRLLARSLQKKGGAGGFGGHGHPGRRRTNSRTSMAQRDEVIRRTVYVSDIDHQVGRRTDPRTP